MMGLPQSWPVRVSQTPTSLSSQDWHVKSFPSGEYAGQWPARCALSVKWIQSNWSVSWNGINNDDGQAIGCQKYLLMSRENIHSLLSFGFRVWSNTEISLRSLPCSLVHTIRSLCVWKAACLKLLCARDPIRGCMSYSCSMSYNLPSSCILQFKFCNHHLSGKWKCSYNRLVRILSHTLIAHQILHVSRYPQFDHNFSPKACGHRAILLICEVVGGSFMKILFEPVIETSHVSTVSSRGIAMVGGQWIIDGRICGAPGLKDTVCCESSLQRHWTGDHRNVAIKQSLVGKNSSDTRSPEGYKNWWVIFPSSKFRILRPPSYSQILSIEREWATATPATSKYLSNFGCANDVF